MENMYTVSGEELIKYKDRIPWEVHPRPLLRRDDFLNLCGWWDFSVYEHGSQIAAGGERIRVPFPPESALSGIKRHFSEGALLVYERAVALPEGFRKDRVLLHIDGADQHIEVYINGNFIGAHDGGYSHCTLDITAYGDSFRLRIEAKDDLRDPAEPYGKQKLKRGGMWYTPFSGLWQPVWIESVPERYVNELVISTDMVQAEIDTKDSSINGTIEVRTPEGEQSFSLEKGKALIRPESPRLWSPEDPYLYHFTLHTQGGDTLRSYFALRQISMGEVEGIKRILLNGRPYFFNGLLDQGYYSDGLSTPADPILYEQDILAARRLGFNTLRKHIKVEPDLYYAACDRLGMIVFQDMVNNGTYSFLLDTALPNVGFDKRRDHLMHWSRAGRLLFLRRMEETVNQLYSFPCILYWTIFNEGWGQFDSKNVCERFRKLDQSRIIDAASGWYDCGAGDVKSVHVYFKPYDFEPSERPVIVSECGGYTLNLSGHSYDKKKKYGYGTAASRIELYEKIKMLYREELLPAVSKGLCGVIYTQLSDVEEEINGLLTYDRKELKLPEDAVLFEDTGKFNMF